MYFDRQEAFQEFYRVIKPEGTLILTVHGKASDYHVPYMAAIEAVLGMETNR